MANAKNHRYRITNFGDNFQITSPFGSQIFIGDVGVSEMRSYKFEIPIEDLRPLNRMDINNAESKKTGDNSKTKFVESEEELLLQANYLYGQGKLSESLDFVDEALRRNNKNIRAWIMKGSLMHLRGESDLAKIHWRKAFKLDPSNKQIKKMLGE